MLLIKSKNDIYRDRREDKDAVEDSFQHTSRRSREKENQDKGAFELVPENFWYFYLVAVMNRVFPEYAETFPRLFFREALFPRVQNFQRFFGGFCGEGSLFEKFGRDHS